MPRPIHEIAQEVRKDWSGKHVLWRGKHVRLVKIDGVTGWNGVGNQSYYPVEYELRGPGYSKVPNMNGVETAGWDAKGPTMMRRVGRIGKKQLAEIIEWAKVWDTLWPSLEAEAETEHKAEERRAEEKEQARLRMEVEAVKERRGRDAWRDLYHACEIASAGQLSGLAAGGNITAKRELRMLQEAMLKAIEPEAPHGL